MLINSLWKDNVITVSRNPILRIFQEITNIRFYIYHHNISLVYSYFGFGLYGKKTKQIIGSADSNLYFPEIDFWGCENKCNKFFRYLIDRYRVYGIKSSSGVIYENQAMFERAKSLYLVNDRALILPSVSPPAQSSKLSVKFKSNHVKILFLCGWQRNKNILLIPELANNLREKGIEVEFILSVTPDDTRCSQEFLKLVENWDVHDLINCIGEVKKSQLPDLYEKIDIVMLLSLLESFSNNIIEAWYYKRSLIISDELWARSICKDAACYVSRNDVEKISKTIESISNSPTFVKKLVNMGSKRLLEFPTVKERLAQELIFIKSFLR